MNKEQAIKQLNKFMNDQVLSFSVKQYPEEKWVAQCNEIDGVITCGVGYDMAQMEHLMQDAILTAAGIPSELSDDLIKRVWSGDRVVPVQTELDSSISTRLFQSTYMVDNNRANHYAGMGRI